MLLKRHNTFLVDDLILVGLHGGDIDGTECCTCFVSVTGVGGLFLFKRLPQDRVESGIPRGRALVGAKAASVEPARWLLMPAAHDEKGGGSIEPYSGEPVCR